jgi:phage baseplate assembly protein W
VEFPARERRSKGDAGALSEEHLREKIEQILFTHPGERVGRPDFGVGLRRMAFEPLDTNRAAVWEDRIRSQLQRWLGEELEVEAVEVGVDGRSGSADIVYRLRLDGRRLRAVFSR